MDPSQNHDSVSLICLVTRRRYKFPQHLCCLRNWKGKGKKRLEVVVTPSSLSPEQRGGALGENRGDRRHPALLRGQQAASKCRQPENMVWRALGSQECFNGDIFNSLCTRRTPLLMACTKANPALTYNLPNPSCLSLLAGCCHDHHLPARGGEEVVTRQSQSWKGSQHYPSLMGSCNVQTWAAEQRGESSPCSLPMQLWKRKMDIKEDGYEGRGGKERTYVLDSTPI